MQKGGGGLAVGRDGPGGEALEVALVVRGRAEGMFIGQAGELDVEALVGVERDLVVAELGVGEGGLELLEVLDVAAKSRLLIGRKPLILSSGGRS